MFGVASADPAPGLELVLQTVPVTGSPSGLAGTKAWGHGVGGGPLWLRSNSQASEGIQSSFGENPQLSGAPHFVLWSAQRAGPGALVPATASNPRGTRRISTNAGTEEATEATFLLLRVQCTVQVSLLPHLSPRHRAPWEPCHAILLCPDVPQESCLLENSLPSAGQGLLSVCCFLVFS